MSENNPFHSLDSESKTSITKWFFFFFLCKHLLTCATNGAVYIFLKKCVTIVFVFLDWTYFNMKWINGHIFTEPHRNFTTHTKMFQLNSIGIICFDTHISMAIFCYCQLQMTMWLLCDFWRNSDPFKIFTVPNICLFVCSHHFHNMYLLTI